MRFRQGAVLALLLLTLAPRGDAAEAIRLKSAILGEDRTIFVRVPAGYAQGNSVHPTIYVTDAESAFDHLCVAAEFLERNRRIPPMIVIGIPNTDRTRNLTPVTEQGRQGAGGGEQFLDFIERELIPHIEKNYRAAPWRVFAGHSLGGLFSLWTLATRPTLFNAHIAISPSIRYGDGIVLERLEKAFAQPWPRPARLWVSTGAEGPENAANFAKLEKLLKRKAPRALDWGTRAFPDEDHGSVVLPSHYYGLRQIFSDWVPELRTATGPIEDPIRHLDAHYAKLTKTYGYEIRTPEETINQIGYRELAAGNRIRGIEILADNARRYPDSPNVYDSLAEAYETDGQMQKARELYKQAWDLAAKRNDPLTDTFRKHYERVAPK
ncbi:MAG: alpha/beta hydrolase-fold protein [Thermoanaerobaculia bacterium]|nr:alpha/beta hydrolase-fold protein [Thermoanaerobaculia bacterium]